MFRSVIFVAGILFGLHASGKVVLTVAEPDPSADMTKAIQQVIDSAARFSGHDEVEIRFAPGVYNISRREATCRRQHISNTTSRDENPDAVKHYGLYLHELSDVTVDGAGATLLTHGEMTSVAIDCCANITLKNLTIDAADPSVTEMTVVSRDDTTLVCNVSESSSYRIASDGRLYWTGTDWEFTGGIAQLYDGVNTWRCPSPTDRYLYAEGRGRTLAFHYRQGDVPQCSPGQVYQMRHSYRTEVATFINRSSDVALCDVTYRFLGNFGIVGQFSRNLTLDHVVCAPASGSGRTCAGFADFVQMSGCSGLVRIAGCDFAGAHDDPINIHGTHLKVTGRDGRWLSVRYMHGQTYGFDPFAVGDDIAAVDANTLRPVVSAIVEEVLQMDDYEYRLRLDRDITSVISDIDAVVVQNLTAEPEVEITGCRFTLTPTRGLLLTTGRKTVIADNEFIRIPMSAILIADDGNSWYESGPVRDVTITRNRFVDCVSPVISISPENRIYDGPVHSGITISDNEFVFSATGSRPVLVSAKATDRLTVKSNKVNCPCDILSAEDCTNVEL